MAEDKRSEAQRPATERTTVPSTTRTEAVVKFHFDGSGRVVFETTREVYSWIKGHYDKEYKFEIRSDLCEPIIINGKPCEERNLGNA